MRCLPRTNSAAAPIELRTLAKERTARSKEQIFYELLRDGGSSACAATFQIALSSDLDLVPIESMVLVEARVLRGDDSMLEIWRDLAHRHEFVPLVIGGVVNPGLQAALNVHHGCRWVDPPSGHNEQRGKRPEKRRTDNEPSENGSDEPLPKRGLAGRVRAFSHISE